MTTPTGPAALAGVTVLITRPRAQSEQLAAPLRDLGATVVEAPTIEIRTGDVDALVDAARELARGGFEAVCLTSPNGVAALASAFDAAGLDRAALGLLGVGPLVASLGPGTTAMLREAFQREPDLVPPSATTRALADALPTGAGRLLLPRADLATDELEHAVRAKGWEPVRVDAYITATAAALPPDAMGRLERGAVDVVVFTSASTARNFAALTRGVSWSAHVVSIGPVTTAACREVGIAVTREANTHDLDGVVAAVVEVTRPA